MNYRSIRPHLGSLVLTIIWAVLRLLPLLIACGLLVGIPFLVYFLVAWFFILPIKALSTQVGSVSKRSRDLVRGEWRRTCAFVLVVLVISAGATVLMGAVVAVIVTGLPGLSDPQAQANVLIVALVFLRSSILPLQVGATTLYFYGLKGRKEGGAHGTVLERTSTPLGP